MSWYKNGLVDVAAGSKIVLGKSTDWVDAVFPGEAFYGPDGMMYEIDCVESKTRLILESDYLGGAQESAPYKIIPNASMAKSLTRQVGTLLANYEGLPQNLASAISFANTSSSLPTTYQGPMLVVTNPHFRFMIWDGVEYVRAPWHRPCDVFYSYDSPSTIFGALPVRADIDYQQSDYPDVVRRLGLSGTGIFSLVEARGEFLRVLDNGRGVDVGRLPRSMQADQIKAHSHDYIYPEGITKSDPADIGSDVTEFATVGVRIPISSKIQTGISGGEENITRNVAFALWMTY